MADLSKSSIRSRSKDREGYNPQQAEEPGIVVDDVKEHHNKIIQSDNLDQPNRSSSSSSALSSSSTLTSNSRTTVLRMCLVTTLVLRL